MSGDKEAMSEQSSVREEAGYDEVFLSGHKPEKGFSYSLERESSAHSPNDEGESYDGEEVDDVKGGEDKCGEGEEDEEYGGKDDRDQGQGDETAPEGGDLESPEDGHTRPFILPKMWTVNDFKTIMMTNIFKNLRDRYQILDNIPICLPRKFEKCYSGKTANVGMYDAMFAVGLRLPLMVLHCQLANFIGLSDSQIAPNAWKIFEMNPSTLVDSSTYRLNNELVLFEDLIINSSTCGFNEFRASPWGELFHLWTQ